jgi:membrane-associated protease RseP (regulator of RpoE activity)
MRVFSADSMVRRFEGMLRYQRDSLFSDTARFRAFSRGRLSEQDSALQRLFQRGAVTAYDSAWSVPDFRARQVEGAAPSVWRLYGNSAAVAGAPLQEVGRQLADALDLGADEGLLVLEVPDGTPARRADLRTGDLIVAAGGQSVGTMAELRRAIDRAPRGEPLLLEVLRKRQRVRLTLPRD